MAGRGHVHLGRDRGDSGHDRNRRSGDHLGPVGGRRSAGVLQFGPIYVRTPDHVECADRRVLLLDIVQLREPDHGSAVHVAAKFKEGEAIDRNVHRRNGSLRIGVLLRRSADLRSLLPM
uniref:(northern house mosquito) hypothetical protein n=1 Tax=Culex pipiens TaxID=7175 RepID=A0A8D8EYD8_CULPI